MKLLAILALAVLAVSHLSAQTETVLKAKATDALTESIVIPSGKSVTIASGATITAASGSTVTGFGGTPAWSDITSKPTTLAGYGISDAITAATAASTYQPLSSTLTTLSSATAAGLALMDDANAAAQRTTLGLGTSSTVQFGTIILNSNPGPWAEGVIYANGFVGPGSELTSLNATNIESGTLNASRLPAAAVKTTDTGTVTNTMLAGSIALSKLSITGTPNGTKFLRDDGTWAAASTDLTAPGPIGGTTPSTGAFTTTTATSVVTADVPGLAITQEWNNGAVSFSALKISATNTASISPATYPSAFLRMFVNGSEVGGLYNYYNSLSVRCTNVEMGAVVKNHGISRQNDLVWNITAADTYVAAIDSDEIRLSSLSDLTWKGDSVPYSGSPDTRIKRTAAAALKVGDATTGYGIIEDLYRRVGGGSPEGAITAPVGCIYHRTDTGDIWRKTSGTGNTGWVTP